MNYYVMTEAISLKPFFLNVEYGRLDFSIQKNPFKDEWTKPITHIFDKDSPETIYFNFDDKKITREADLKYDYYATRHGHIISQRLWSVLSKFNVQEHISKNLKFTIDGEVINTQEFNFFSFSNDKPDFINYDQSILYPVKESPLAPIQMIAPQRLVLQENIGFDVFKLSYVFYLADLIVVNEEVKQSIEALEGLGYIKFLPVQTAFEEYCRENLIDFTKLLARKKPKIPGIHY